MLRNISIVPRLVGVVVGGGIVMTALTLGLVYHQMSQTLGTAEERELSEVFRSVEASIASRGAEAQALSALVAGIPAVQEAFAADRRDVLHDLFVPGFNDLKNDYGVRQFQFHTPPATSYLRVHKPERQGPVLDRRSRCDRRPALVRTPALPGIRRIGLPQSLRLVLGSSRHRVREYLESDML